MKPVLLKTTTLIVTLLLAITVTSHTAIAGSVARIQTFTDQSGNEKHGSGIQPLAAATLDDIIVDDTVITDISALAWDEDESKLFAVSDNGYLLHLRPVFNAGELVDIIYLDGFRLLDKQGDPLGGKHADSEGIAIKNERNNINGDTELYISFERVPRIVQYSLRGEYIKPVLLPPVLRHIENYRGENYSLESLLYHDNLGFLTGPEFPLQTDSPGQLVVYALDGQLWRLLAHDPVDGALVDLAAMSKGRILVLERAYKGAFPGLVVTLHCLDPDDQRMTSEIHTLEAGEPGFNENFEGLALIRDRHYMMISDDNNHPLKQTVLVYFKLNLPD